MKRNNADLIILLAVVVGLACALVRCTIKIEAPPWPDGGLVELPPIEVPCVENREAGWYCVWPDGGVGK